MRLTTTSRSLLPELLTTITILVVLASPPLARAQITIFDHLGIKNLRLGREMLFKFAGATGENRADFRTNLKNNVSQVTRGLLLWSPQINSLLIIPETAKAVQSQRTVLLRRERSRQKKCDTTDFGAPAASRRYRYCRRHWWQFDGWKWGTGHKHHPSGHREQRTLLDYWRSEELARIPHHSEHSKGV